MSMNGFFQNAYVTRDLDKAVALFRDQYGLDDFLFLKPEMDVTTMWGNGPVSLKAAFAWVDNLQIELIEPVSGFMDVYVDFLAADYTPRFHHTCFRTHDMAKTRADIKKKNWSIAYEGSMEGAEWVYVDARKTLGHYVEYMWGSPEMWKFMRTPEHLL